MFVKSTKENQQNNTDILPLNKYERAVNQLQSGHQDSG